MIRSYDEDYLNDAMKNLAIIFDYGINDCGIPSTTLIKMFISSKLSYYFEIGHPSFVSGKSGLENVAYMYELINKNEFEYKKYIIKGSLTKEYWVGYVLAYYQWYSSKTYKEIFDKISFDELIRKYHPYHEMDITHFVNYLEEIINNKKLETNLAKFRKINNLSQSQFAKLSNVSLRSIQLYEQRVNDIDKAQVHTLYKFAKVLHCSIEDLLENPSI